jgi:hypothetical protein
LVLRETLPRKIAAFPALDECCHTSGAVAPEDLPGSQLAGNEKYVEHFRFEQNLRPPFALGDEVISIPFDCANQIGRGGVAAGVGIAIREDEIPAPGTPGPGRLVMAKIRARKAGK